MQPSGRGYDHGVSTFSPDGRLYQVEYARESVKRGTTTVGLKFRDGVVLIVDKRISSKLVIIDSIEKILWNDVMYISQYVTSHYTADLIYLLLSQRTLKAFLEKFSKI